MRTNEQCIGYIAEELHEINPVLVTTNADGHPEGVEWNNITLCLIEELKVLRNEITALKTELNALKNG